MNLKCPKCKKRVSWEDNEWRPFCSERCKMVDLGAWVSEDYRITEEAGEYEDQDPPDEEGRGGL